MHKNNRNSSVLQFPIIHLFVVSSHQVCPNAHTQPPMHTPRSAGAASPNICSSSSTSIPCCSPVWLPASRYVPTLTPSPHCTHPALQVQPLPTFAAAVARPFLVAHLSGYQPPGMPQCTHPAPQVQPPPTIAAAATRRNAGLVLHCPH